MTTTQDILEKTNYYICYNFDAMNNTGRIYSTYDPEIDFSFKYEEGQLISNLETIDCPPYMAQIIIDTKLREICEQYNFPYDLVIKRFNDNKTYYLRFPVPGMDENQLETMMEIAAELQTVGLKPSVVTLVKEAGVQDGFKILFNYLYDAKIDL